MKANAIEKTEAPPNALTWGSAVERKAQLKAWRRVVFKMFGEQTRALRLAWVLSDMFSISECYAFPTNRYLADETGIARNKVQAALAELEHGEAIVRAEIVRVAGKKWRAIYPCRTLLPHPRRGGRGGPPAAGGPVNKTIRAPRVPSSQLQLAALAARLHPTTDEGEADPQQEAGEKDG
jgi:hypothetical protein